MSTTNTLIATLLCFPTVPVSLRWRFSTSRRTEQWSPCVSTPLWSPCSTTRPFLWRACAAPSRNVWSKSLSLQNTWMTKLFITFSLVDVLSLEGLRFVLCYFGGLMNLSFTVCVSSMLRSWHLCPRDRFFLHLDVGEGPRVSYFLCQSNLWGSGDTVHVLRPGRQVCIQSSFACRALSPILGFLKLSGDQHWVRPAVFSHGKNFL